MNRIKECRLKKGMSQKFVALSLGVSPPSVWGWENDKNDPTQENLSALADLFGVSVDYLIGREESPKEVPWEPIKENPRPLMLDGEGVKGWPEDRPETQKIAAKVMANALSFGATKEEVVDFNNLFFRLLPEERRTFINSMKALNSQRDKEEGT